MLLKNTINNPVTAARLNSTKDDGCKIYKRYNVITNSKTPHSGWAINRIPSRMLL